MPVCLVITELDVGGAEKALVSLSTRLDRDRWAPSVIALGPEGPLADALRAVLVPVECLDVSRRRPLQAVRRLARALRAHRPWLVQSFLFHANVAARLAAACLRPSPWTLAGLRVAERGRAWHLLLDRLTAGLGTGAVCVSRGVARFSVETGRWPADRLAVIPNGVDPTLFDPVEPCPRAALGVPEEAHLALFVGRLDVQKGLPTLLDAAARVAAARTDWHLAVVGDGPEAGPLRERTEGDPGLIGRVHWLGRREDVPRLLKTADLLVLPSLWEGMPNVALEAMAAGRAVVATAVEGSEDLVVPGRTGWLVPPGDPRALAGALLEAAADPERLRRLGLAGRERVAAEFSPRAMVDAYERLWAAVLGLEWPAPEPSPS